MLFSVVIPAKNRSALLVRALRSLEAQTCTDFEVIVVDDNSTEDLAAVVARFDTLQARVIRSDGTGAAVARNRGTDAAMGEFVAYLDSDDVFLPEKLARVADRIARTDASILASPLYVWRGDSHVQVRPSRPPRADEDISEFYFVSDERMQSSSFIVRTTLAREVRWNELLKKVQDPDFMIRLARAGGRVSFIEDPLAVLFDDVTAGRISTANFEGNMRAWLAAPTNPLSPKAKKGFRLYALSYEVAHRSRWAAIGLVLGNCTAVHPRIVLKTLYRLAVPEAIFKRTARMAVRLKPGSNDDRLVRYIQGLETA